MGGEEREDVMDVGRKGEREKRERRKREREEEGGTNGANGKEWQAVNLCIHKCTHEHPLGAMASISPGFPAELTSISLKLTSTS